MKKIIFFLFITAAFFSSCVSLKKDISLNSQSSQSDKNIEAIEEAVVPLEAVGGAQARSRPSEVTAARQLITNKEKEASADAEYTGKLLAWSGRLAIIEGKYSDAQRLYRQSTAASAGNVPAIILGIRLEGDPAKRLEMIEKELAISGRQSSAVGFGELQIERGVSLTETNRFAEAAGAFDAAFATGINKVYKDNYVNMRNRAWELRNTSGVATGTMNMMQDRITWNDCINIARNETQLLRFISGGRNLSEADFFTRLLDRAFIPYTQDIAVSEWPKTKPDRGEFVTRAGAAWFIWHLYAEMRADKALLSRYSTRYATGANPRSPIADIPPLSPFFDSILGSVETELLSLPDGKNFRPAQPIRGSEMLSVLKKIDN
jgi:tetratricopeptide (TPR) repeat protein